MPDDTALAHRAAIATFTERPTDTPGDTDLAIACVPWPSDAHRRDELARAGVPRLLFVAPGADPPEPWDLDEDWVRVPVLADEVLLRADTLRSRLRSRRVLTEVIRSPA